MDSATTDVEQAGIPADPVEPIKLSPTTAAVYEAILGWFRDTGGAPPSIREIMRRCGFNSTSVVSYHLRRLTAVGLIRLAPGASRSVMLTGARWTPPPPARIEVSRDAPGTPEQLRAYWSKAKREERARAAKAAEVAA